MESWRCHFPAILRGMHDDENDDGHKGYDPWGHLLLLFAVSLAIKNLICRDISFMLLLLLLLKLWLDLVSKYVDCCIKEKLGF